MATFTSDLSAFSAAQGFFTSAHLVARYQLFKSFNRYYYFSGLAMMPVAARAPTGIQPPVKSRTVQLAQPFGYRVYTWAVEREGERPVLPSPVPQNPDNEVLIDAQVCLHDTEVDASGTCHSYFAEGVYVYQLKVPLLNGTLNTGSTLPIVDQLRMGGTPYDTTPADDNIYTPADFVPLQ